MTYRELLEWEVFLETHPPTGELIDWQLATLLATLSAVFGKRAPVGHFSLLERMRPRTAEEISADLRRQFGIPEE